MKVFGRLSGGLLLLAGCRQPNPDWEGPEGPADADAGTVSTVSTAGSTVDPDTGPSSNSMPDGDAPEVMTEGEHCNNDNQCPDGWVCGPMGCQLGGDGDACNGDGDCQAPTSICSTAGMCQDGSEGDPCAENGDCMTPTGICGPAMVCQSGEAGQACTTPDHCAPGLDCTAEGVCG